MSNLTPQSIYRFPALLHQSLCKASTQTKFSRTLVLELTFFPHSLVNVVLVYMHCPSVHKFRRPWRREIQTVHMTDIYIAIINLWQIRFNGLIFGYPNSYKPDRTLQGKCYCCIVLRVEITNLLYPHNFKT